MRVSAAVFLYSLACTTALGLGCLETAVFERPASQGAIGLESNIQALVPQYVFRCSGTVIEWQAYVVTGGPYSIEFQVWRPDPELENTYNRVGTNRFPDVANASKLLLLRVQQQQQRISVEPEDIVGFAVFSNRNESFELNVEENVYVLFEEIVDPRADRSSYELSYGSGSGYDPVLPHVHGAPLVNAVVRPDSAAQSPDPAPTATVSHTPSTSATVLVMVPAGGTSENTLPAKTIIIIAVAGTFFTTLLIIVALGLLRFLYVWKKLQTKSRRESAQLQLHSAHDRPTVPTTTKHYDHIYAEPSTTMVAVNNPVYNGMTDNVAYLERSLSENMMINPAYALINSGSSELGNIPAQMDMDYRILPGSADHSYEPMSPTMMLEADAKETEAKPYFETGNTSEAEYENVPRRM